MGGTMALHAAAWLVGGEAAEKALLMVVEKAAEMVEYEAYEKVE
jgi:hypothetical protein